MKKRTQLQVWLVMDCSKQKRTFNKRMCQYTKGISSFFYFAQCGQIVAIFEA